MSEYKHDYKHDHKHDHKKCKGIEDILRKLPPNSAVAGVYVNGGLVPLAAFSNLCDCLAYFIDEAGQVYVINVDSIDLIAFGEADVD
ncbi:hypothetical protein [Bacillus suaedae]|uniref:Uncharacterized protein n=1 Tax=Halalkalibacter suaedae TaxID=2822140 RepID=A0A940WU32_9BACI|nr:hypothetical protein [Bacillus suaedae]MBP3950467.1 hypothetical protein [Bacillus suaedae]